MISGVTSSLNTKISKYQKELLQNLDKMVNISQWIGITLTNNYTDVLHIYIITNVIFLFPNIIFMYGHLLNFKERSNDNKNDI